MTSLLIPLPPHTPFTSLTPADTVHSKNPRAMSDDAAATQYREAFDLFDASQSGVLDVDEVTMVCACDAASPPHNLCRDTRPPSHAPPPATASLTHTTHNTTQQLMRALGRDIDERQVQTAFATKFGLTGAAADGALEVTFEHFCELMNQESHRPPSLEELEEAWDAFSSWDPETSRFVAPAAAGGSGSAGEGTVDVATLKALLTQYSESMGKEEVNRLLEVIDRLCIDTASGEGGARIGKEAFLKLFTPTSYRDMVADTTKASS